MLSGALKELFFMKTIRNLIAYISSIFITGIISLLPLTLTISLFHFSYNILKSWLRPLYLLEPAWLHRITYSEFLLALILILFVGLILNFLFLRPIFYAIENTINKVPLIRPVYTGFKQLIQAFNPSNRESFKQVVLIEFPRAGIYSIGFVTRELPPDLTPNPAEQYVSVFIPTTPMPTTGYFLVVATSHIKVLNISRQEAMTLIISGGIIQPARFMNHQAAEK